MEAKTVSGRVKKELHVLMGEQIRFYREQSGLSRERMAELAGVTPRFLADAELGYVGISLSTLKRICEALGVSADRILWRDRQETISLAERLSHVDDSVLPLLEEMIQKQLEILALARQNTEK